MLYFLPISRLFLLTGWIVVIRALLLLTCLGGGLQPGHSTISHDVWVRTILSALVAAMLLAASPLMISHMWSQLLHVAHSASLVPCFLVALLLLADQRLALGWRVVGLASVLYVASLTYQIPVGLLCLVCFLSRFWGKRRLIWILSIVNRYPLVHCNDIIKHIKFWIRLAYQYPLVLNDPLLAVSSRPCSCNLILMHLD